MSLDIIEELRKANRHWPWPIFQRMAFCTAARPIPFTFWNGKHPLEVNMIHGEWEPGTTLKIVMTSRFGDVGLTDRLNATLAVYQARVYPDRGDIEDIRWTREPSPRLPGASEPGLPLARRSGHAPGPFTGADAMSWSINLSGTPDEITSAIKAYSDAMYGQNKEEFDAAMPHLVGLVAQNFATDEYAGLYPGHAPTAIAITAWGSGIKSRDAHVRRECNVKIEQVYRPATDITA